VKLDFLNMSVERSERVEYGRLKSKGMQHIFPLILCVQWQLWFRINSFMEKVDLVKTGNQIKSNHFNLVLVPYNG